MRIGIGTGVTSARCLRTVRTPRSLFRSGDQGFWLDPGDLSSLSQNAVGTVPVMAFGQPVGRVQDRSGTGLHVAQANPDLRLLYARVPTGGVRNLFQNSRFAGIVVGGIAASVSSEGAIINRQNIAGVPFIEVAAVGVDNVGEWLDIRIHGANTSGAPRFYNLIDASLLPALPGEVCTVSVDLQVISNTGPRTPNVWFIISRRDAAKLGLPSWHFHNSWIAPSMTRFSVTTTPHPAEAAFLGNRGLFLAVDTGHTVDYTLRVRRMQVEVGSVETSYQATRRFSADVTETSKADRFSLRNDLLNDSLRASKPAGTYTVAFADDAGVTILTGQALSGAFAIPGPARLYGCLAINRALSASETASLTTWLHAKRP